MRLLELRKKAGISQNILANALDCSQNMISQWENGTRDPGTDTLRLIADYFNVTIDYLLDYDLKCNAPIDINNNLKKIRISHNIKQADLAKKLNVTQGMLSGWETGRYEISNNYLIKIAQCFNVTTDYILGLEKENDILKLSSVENDNLKKYRKLDLHSQKEINDFIDFKLYQYNKSGD